MAVAVELFPRDAELARRAAGGDGAAFVRLYDKYATEVFTTALATTGSIEEAAEATQDAFLRVLRWPPPYGAPDSDVSELLCALALGGHDHFVSASSDTPEAQAIARLVGVGWLRSETVAEAGARFDADWSVHLWSPPADDQEALPPLRTRRLPRRRLRLRLPRLTLRAPVPSSPAFAVTAAVTLVLFASAGGTLLAMGGGGNEAAPAAREGEQLERSERAELRRDDERKAKRPQGEAKPLQDKPLKSLLAP